MKSQNIIHFLKLSVVLVSISYTYSSDYVSKVDLLLYKKNLMFAILDTIIITDVDSQYKARKVYKYQPEYLERDKLYEKIKTEIVRFTIIKLIKGSQKTSFTLKFKKKFRKENEIFISESDWWPYFVNEKGIFGWSNNCDSTISETCIDFIEIIRNPPDKCVEDLYQFFKRRNNQESTEIKKYIPNCKID